MADFLRSSMPWHGQYFILGCSDNASCLEWLLSNQRRRGLAQLARSWRAPIFIPRHYHEAARINAQ